MHAYHAPRAARATVSAVRAWIEDTCAACPVLGFDRLVRRGDAVENRDRLSGFLECHGGAEWFLPLAARHGLTWQSAEIPETAADRIGFLLALGFGNGSPLPQASGQWDIAVNGHHAVSIRVVNHSQVWRQGECALSFSANRQESAPPWGGITLSSTLRDEAFATFGPALLTVPRAWIETGARATLTATPACPVQSTRWLQILQTHSLFHQSHIYPAVEALTRDDRPRSGGLPVFFGDIHTHSAEADGEPHNEGCGRGTREENYTYARGPGGVDFYALTDHEWQVRPNGQETYFGLADTFEEPGRFVCLPAFEHTSPAYGHRNVYFRTPRGIIVSNTYGWREGRREDPPRYRTPEDLWQALQENGTPFMTVPHHPSATSHPCTWDFFNPDFDRLVEVYSVWGSSEYYGDFPRGVSDRYRELDVQDAIRRGLFFGLIASADGHDGHPGNAQSPYVKHHHQYHFCGSGRAAVLAPELTRDAVFDALHARRCYATTGTPIHLDVQLHGQPMGSTVAAGGKRPVLRVECTGTNGIDHVRIVKNGAVVAALPQFESHTCTLEWPDEAWEDGLGAQYYVRVVQRDRESAWSSPIQVR